MDTPITALPDSNAVARRFNTTREVVLQWVARGQLVPTRARRRLHFTEAALTAFALDREVRANVRHILGAGPALTADDIAAAKNELGRLAALHGWESR